MAKRRNSFARIGILALVMLVALGVLGATFSVWAETLYIDGTVSIGITSGGLVSGSGSHSYDGTSISWQAAGEELEVTVTNAQPYIAYTCEFDVKNTGSIPVKIQSIEIADVPSKVDVWVAGDVYEGQQIEPAGMESGTVHVTVDPESTVVGDNFTSTVTIKVVQWNLYVP